MKHLLIFLHLLFVWLPFSYRGQTVLFSENLGTTGAGANPLITVFGSFQNSACSYTYAGSGDVRNSTVSSGYAGASGTNNVYLNTNRSFIISGINTLGYSAISLSYGLYNSGFLSTAPALMLRSALQALPIRH